MQNVLITGASGFLAQSLISYLYNNGYTIKTLSRNTIEDNRIQSFKWDVDLHSIDKKAFENIDILIHLAGENIADKSWTNSRKNAIIDSRVKSTELIFEILTKYNIHLKCYIGASATGFYGNRGDELLDETSIPGNNFLAETCIKWEQAHLLIKPLCSRHIIVRLPVVLDTKQGALPKILMTLPFALNYFDKGNQFMPWITIDDLISVFSFFIENEKTQGIFNVNHPQVLCNKEFVLTLGQLKKHITPILPIPAFVLRIIMGESASLVLDGQKTNSQKLLDAGFVFPTSSLKESLTKLFS